MGAATGDAPQFIPVLQLWAAWTFRTQLPDATEAGPAVLSAELEAASGSFKTGTSALHHPRGYPRGSSSDGGYVFSVVILFLYYLTLGHLTPLLARSVLLDWG